MSSIACQLSFVRSTLPEGVKLVAVSKTHPAEAIRAAKPADIALSELGRMLEDEYRKQ